jgi:hypothetical protein
MVVNPGRTLRGDVIHLVVPSSEGVWAPYDRNLAVERAKTIVNRLIEQRTYA